MSPVSNGMFNHHAYHILGTLEGVLPRFKELLENEGVSLHGNPDYIELLIPSLGVDDVRALEGQVHTRVSPESRRIVILAFTQATSEAQNALLKTTEEPGERTHFFFVTPTRDTLLPTLRSRLQEFPVGEPSPKLGARSPDAEDFIKSSFAQRLELLAPIIEEKQHDRALSLCNGIENILSKKGQENREVLMALETARQYLLRRGSSLKLILEFVALSVPRV